MTVTPCPTCRRPVEWSEKSPWRPFCSERCKLVDFGDWITERHVIPAEPAEDALGDSPGAEGDGNEPI